ncbi:glycosyltransferase family protein [Kordia jejudonensis]|uniref:hypothetical protein n=1 Tax=Kordia jejudonensis TaxID=1348245 RepID=UPI000629362D|nr:hypothetical protein [Kordia jejudonensis]
MTSKPEIILIIRIANIDERVRLSKNVHYFTSRDYGLELWKKKGTHKSIYNEKDICKTYNSKGIEYILWMTGLFFRLLFRKRKKLVFVSGYESALMVYLVSLIRGGAYIYDNPDNFYQSKQLPKLLKKLVFWIDCRIINRARITVVPDHSRIPGYNIDHDRFLVIKNFPSLVDYKKSEALGLKKTHKLVLYTNGWLVPTRGLNMMSEFIGKLEDGLDLEIKITGKKEGLGENILGSKYVNYLGVVDATTSLAHYYTSDVILTFYDPALEINRKASPNKWGDALVTKTVPILNSEIETTGNYFPEGGYFAIKYNDADALHQLTMDLYNDKTLLENKQKELKQNPIYFWEDQMDKLPLSNAKK